MKTILSTALLFTCLNTVTAQDVQKISTGDFNTIEANSHISANIIQSDSNYVAFESKSNNVQNATIEAHNGVLFLGDITKKFRITGSHMTVYAKNLTAVIARDASTVKSDNPITTDRITITAYDASRIKLTLKAKKIEVTAKDASSVTLFGTADNLVISASDASYVMAYGLKVGAADVIATDASSVKAFVLNKVVAKAGDASKIHISGNPAQKTTSADNNGAIKIDETG
jgi:hypothetical protein